MTHKIVLPLLFLSNLLLIQGVPYCCNGTNVIRTMKKCRGGGLVQIRCTNGLLIQKDENLTEITPNDDLILHETNRTLLPNDYCETNLKDGREVLIVCYDEAEKVDVPTAINTYLQIITIIFIILTVTVYFLIPEVLPLQEICIIHSISGLAIGFLADVIIKLSGYLVPVKCHLVAYISYFSYMYSYFWLNILCFHIWREVRNIEVFERVKSWKIIYHVYGIGAPSLALSWVMFVNHANLDALKHIHPGIGYETCYFRTMKATFVFFYIPIAVLLLINIIFFVWTAVILWDQSERCMTRKVQKYRLRMLFKLFFLMGIQWIFEILSAVFLENTPRWLWIITDAFNSGQGLLIFLILVVFRKKIKRSFANRNICGYRLPARWKNDGDSECEDLREVEYTLNERI